VRSVAQQPITI